MCLHFGMTIDGNKDQCINPEGFASFLSLLESIPFHDVGLDYGSKEHAMPDSRYVIHSLVFFSPLISLMFEHLHGLTPLT